MRTSKTLMRGLMAGVMALGLAACEDTMDLGRFGGSGGADRPQPDARGVISYPTYQVAVAGNGDTVRLMAERLGQDAEAMGRLNGIHPDAALRLGEVVVLPTEIETLPVADGEGHIGDGPVRRPGSVDIATIAGDAINTADPARARPTGPEPGRHVVQAGETAEGVAARYGVRLSDLMELNGIRSNTSLRTGQILLIPENSAPTKPPLRPTAAVTPPGAQSPVPKPPSSSTPLPKAETAASAPPEPATPAAAPPDTKGTLTMPVKGSIIRDFQKGKSDGIDISAPAGSAVVAAGDGTVAAITRDTKGVPILVIRHDGGLLTVYAGIDELTVSRGDTVKRGQKIAVVRDANPAFLHFETRRGIDSIDPADFL